MSKEQENAPKVFIFYGWSDPKYELCLKIFKYH